MKDNSSTALITGGAKRLGRIFALALAQKGWNIILHYHTTSHEEIYCLKQEIETWNVICFLIKADFRNTEDVTSFFTKLPIHIGPVTLLINNASLFEKDVPFSVSTQNWDNHMTINTRAPFFLMQQFFNHLPSTKKGTIVNMVDYSVMCVTSNFTSYNMSKSMLWNITQHLALAFAPRVRVNAIGLSVLLQNKRQSLSHFQAMQHNSPLQIAPDIEELCKTLDYILESRSLTGQLLLLDGGLHLKNTHYG